jgi:Secretion system C-terminal sorting domain/SprB repeat
MKKLILIALVCSALYSSATGYFGVKPIVNEPNCYGQNNGSIQLSVLGGTAPFTYQWSGGLVGTNIVNNVPAGSYTVTVTDANGLNAYYTVVVAQPYQIQIQTGTTNVTLHGGNNGSANITVDGGTPNYSYLWSNGETTQNISNLYSGTYTVTVTDAVGCTSTASENVTQPARPNFHGAIYLNGNQQTKSLEGSGNDNSGTKASGATGLNLPASNLKSEDVQVFPNPATSQLTLKTGEATNNLVSMFDINGQKVSEQLVESTETTLNVSTLPAGNYIVEIKSADGSVVNKKVTIK